MRLLETSFSDRDALLTAIDRGAQDRSRIHIITRGPRWAMFRAGAKRASGVFADRGEALVKAQRVAQRDPSITEIIVHNYLGQIDFRVPTARTP